MAAASKAMDSKGKRKHLFVVDEFPSDNKRLRSTPGNQQAMKIMHHVIRESDVRKVFEDELKLTLTVV